MRYAQLARMLETLYLLANRPFDKERIAIQAAEWEAVLREIPTDDLVPAARKAHTEHDGYGDVCAADVLMAWHRIEDARNARLAAQEKPDPTAGSVRVAVTAEQAIAASKKMRALERAGDTSGIAELTRRCAQVIVDGAGKSACGRPVDVASARRTLGLAPPDAAVCNGSLHLRYSAEWDERTVGVCPSGPLRNMRESAGG